MECDSIAVLLLRQALFAGRVEQSRAQMTVNLNDAASHTIGKIVEFHLRALRALRGEAVFLKSLATPNEQGNGAVLRSCFTESFGYLVD